MNFINGMANISKKSAKLTPFGGIFSIMEHFDAKLSSVIDSSLVYDAVTMAINIAKLPIIAKIRNFVFGKLGHFF